MTIHGKFIKTLTYPLLSRSRDNAANPELCRELNQSQYFSRNQLAQLQLGKLKRLLAHAYENCTFYRTRLDRVGFDPASFTSIEQLREIPPLTKSDLTSSLPDLVARNYGSSLIHKAATGGSTGKHTPFYRDNQCLKFKKSVEYRGNSWAGWDIGEKIAYYWPAIQDVSSGKSWKARLKNQIYDRSLMLYSGKQNEQILEDHYAKLASFRPQLLRVFPNPLSTLAHFIQSTHKKPLNIPAIISVGEPLLKSHRKLFEEVFQAKVFNCYVSRECGNMACECGDSPGDLHVNAEMVYIEPLEDSPNGRTSPVKLLVTDLTNYGMPFIRYQIEDMGLFPDVLCPCGRGLPLLRMEAGRASDFLISPHDRSRISGCSLLHYLVAEGPSAGQIQIVQDRMDHLTINMARTDPVDQDTRGHFDAVIEKFFQGHMSYDIEYVPTIEREKSMKFFFTKCLISDDLSQ